MRVTSPPKQRVSIQKPNANSIFATSKNTLSEFFQNGLPPKNLSNKIPSDHHSVQKQAQSQKQREYIELIRELHSENKRLKQKIKRESNKSQVSYQASKAKVEHQVNSPSLSRTNGSDKQNLSMMSSFSPGRGFMTGQKGAKEALEKPKKEEMSQTFDKFVRPSSTNQGCGSTINLFQQRPNALNNSVSPFCKQSVRILSISPSRNGNSQITTFANGCASPRQSQSTIRSPERAQFVKNSTKPSKTSATQSEVMIQAQLGATSTPMTQKGHSYNPSLLSYQQTETPQNISSPNSPKRTQRQYFQRNSNLEIIGSEESSQSGHSNHNHTKSLASELNPISIKKSLCQKRSKQDEKCDKNLTKEGDQTKFNLEKNIQNNKLMSMLQKRLSEEGTVLNGEFVAHGEKRKSPIAQLFENCVSNQNAQKYCPVSEEKSEYDQNIRYSHEPQQNLVNAPQDARHPLKRMAPISRYPLLHRAAVVKYEVTEDEAPVTSDFAAKKYPTIINLLNQDVQVNQQSSQSIQVVEPKEENCIFTQNLVGMNFEEQDAQDEFQSQQRSQKGSNQHYRNSECDSQKNIKSQVDREEIFETDFHQQSCCQAVVNKKKVSIQEPQAEQKSQAFYNRERYEQNPFNQQSRELDPRELEFKESAINGKQGCLNNDESIHNRLNNSFQYQLFYGQNSEIRNGVASRNNTLENENCQSHFKVESENGWGEEVQQPVVRRQVSSPATVVPHTLSGFRNNCSFRNSQNVGNEFSSISSSFASGSTLRSQKFKKISNKAYL